MHCRAEHGTSAATAQGKRPVQYVGAVHEYWTGYARRTKSVGVSSRAAAAHIGADDAGS